MGKSTPSFAALSMDVRLPLVTLRLTPAYGRVTYPFALWFTSEFEPPRVRSQTQTTLPTLTLAL